MNNFTKCAVSIYVIFFASTSLAAKLPKNIINMDKAKEIAIKAGPGEIKSSEIEMKQ